MDSRLFFRNLICLTVRERNTKFRLHFNWRFNTKSKNTVLRVFTSFTCLNYLDAVSSEEYLAEIFFNDISLICLIFIKVNRRYSNLISLLILHNRFSTDVFLFNKHLYIVNLDELCVSEAYKPRRILLLLIFL